MYPDPTGDLLGILEELQKRHPRKFLPRPTLCQVATKTGFSRSRVFSVTTFYSFFNLEPQGEHVVMVCRGTACHTRGSKGLLDRLRERLALEPCGSESEAFRTADNRLTVRTVACFGQCALAPVLSSDEDIHSHVTEAQLDELILRLKTGAQRHEDPQKPRPSARSPDRWFQDAGVRGPAGPGRGHGHLRHGHRRRQGAGGAPHGTGAAGRRAILRPVGCFGFCAAEPFVNIRLPGRPW
ncbi:MAG: NAD(P)H-dependent oxidoreductase subunit E [Kiritimatiellia bacterium]